MRKTPAILALIFAVVLLFNALAFLGKAYSTMAAAAPVAYRQQYIHEYLWSFAFSLLFALALGWWGVARLRRRRAAKAVVKGQLRNGE